MLPLPILASSIPGILRNQSLKPFSSTPSLEETLSEVVPTALSQPKSGSCPRLERTEEDLEIEPLEIS